MVEDGVAGLEALSAELFPGPDEFTVGLTGSPGVGKSTIVGELVGVARAQGRWSRCWRSTRRRPCRAARCSAIDCVCRRTRRIPVCSSARWRRAGISAGWRSPRPRRSVSSTRRGTTLIDRRERGVGQARSTSRPPPTSRWSSVSPGWGDAAPGREGRDPGDRGRLRREQGRSRGLGGSGSRPPADAAMVPSCRGRPWWCRPPRPRAPASTSCGPRSSCTGPISRPPASSEGTA